MDATARRVRTELGQLELYSEPAPGKRNEDVVDAAGPAAWLLDAAGADDDPQACREHDAAWYGQWLSAAIAEQLAACAQRPLPDVLADAITAVTSEHHDACNHAQRGHGPSSTVVIVRRLGDGLDYLVLGDSSLLVEVDATVHHHSDRRLASVALEHREAIRRALRAGCRYDEPAHLRRVAALRAAERAARNSDDGYWIASDDPEAAHHALTGRYDRRPGRAALLSDGLERAVTRLGIYHDYAELLTALSTAGPAACVAATRRAEADSPVRSSQPSATRSDDASALTCRLVARDTAWSRR